ncbi:hypothetical protein DFH06DRAFT_316156 [Mycena polygramma]|nr:hypothetical protein DFH06DRAFT_316156 [Mycena polygramma]
MVQSSAITFEDIERRHALMRAVELGVCCAGIEFAEPSEEHKRLIDAALIVQIRTGLLAVSPWTADTSSMDTRFEIEKVGRGFKIYDKRKRLAGMVSETQLLDPTFDFQAWYRACGFGDLAFDPDVALGIDLTGRQLQDTMDTHLAGPGATSDLPTHDSELEDPGRETEGESRASVIGPKAVTNGTTHAQTSSSSPPSVIWHTIFNPTLYSTNHRYFHNGVTWQTPFSLLYGHNQDFTLTQRPSSISFRTRKLILLASAASESASINIVLLIDFRRGLVESWAWHFSADSGRISMEVNGARGRDWSWYVLIFSCFHILSTYILFYSWSL